jgi:MAF protein
MKNIILASNSPRRKELFSLFGWPFEVVPADIDEDRIPGEKPRDYVRRLACEKAQKVATNHHGFVIAADTIVVDGDELLGKPADENQARQMLTQLRGRVHQVFTGIALVDTDTEESYSDVCRTDVLMRKYTDDEIEAYIATGDPMDKAGAYAIQHSGFNPVEKLSDCYASVMGLPICQLSAGLKKFGFSIPEDLPQRCQELLDYACPILADVMNQD